MHELDQMTPNQRLNAFMTGQSMDRMLAMPVIVSMSGDVCGMTHREKEAHRRMRQSVRLKRTKDLVMTLQSLNTGFTW